VTKKEIKNLLQKYHLRPSRRLGQNFLIDEKVLRKIIEAAELSKNDIVLEVGPGIGNLTTELAKRVKKVITIEKDKKMVEILRETLKNFTNIEIIEGDILKINLKPYTSKPYKVVANIPYYLTSPLIRKFLECNEERPRYMILMVQKEVAQRIVARPPDMSILAVSVQFYAKPEIISLVSKKSFWPQPKVDSAIIKIKPLINTDKKLINADLFFKIVKAGFSQPRKQLINNFSKGLKFDKKKVEVWFWKNKIQPTQRAETLNLEDWINLTKSFIILER
jgi:16S rRNA (adenine1518-N6/adenine1519-N6)-dimethyltransferase